MRIPKNKTKPLIFVTAISILAGVLIISYTDFPFIAVIAGIVAVIFFYVSASINRFNKRIIKSLSILNEQLDPKAYIKEIDELLSGCRNKNQEIQLLINKSAGLYWNGDFNRCLKQLQSIDEKCIYNDILIAVYHINIASCKLMLGDIHGSESELSKIDNKNAFISNAKEQIKCNISLEKGNFEGAEEYYQKMYKDSPAKINKCFAKYCLARIYMSKDNIEDVKKSLKYVAENASNLYFYKSAKEMFSKIK